RHRDEHAGRHQRLCGGAAGSSAMTFNFIPYRLDAAIAESARKAFAAALSQYPQHNFFAFALTTLAEVQFIECSLNSDLNFAKVLPDTLPYNRFLTEEQQKLYYKWSPNEWGEFEYFAQSEQNFFAPVQELLNQIETDAGEVLSWEESFDSRRVYVFDMMVAALKALDEDGCFGQGERRFQRLAFADIYDDSTDVELRSRSVKEINMGKASPALINEFLGLER
ncbi:MAG: DUF4303 domain-containing protein, partial [Hyphomicrobium sp.]